MVKSMCIQESYVTTQIETVAAQGKHSQEQGTEAAGSGHTYTGLQGQMAQLGFREQHSALKHRIQVLQQRQDHPAASP